MWIRILCPFFLKVHPWKIGFIEIKKTFFSCENRKLLKKKWKSDFFLIRTCDMITSRLNNCRNKFFLFFFINTMFLIYILFYAVLAIWVTLVALCAHTSVCIADNVIQCSTGWACREEWVIGHLIKQWGVYAIERNN